MKNAGLFIAFEGGDGAGKSTQVNLLVSRLRDTGRAVLATREPGAGEFGKRVRSILLDPATGDISPRAELLLFCADRAEHVDSIVKPALARGEVVVTDRYVDSTFAYQGAGRALDMSDVWRVCWWAADWLAPDLTVVLDVDPDVAEGRLGGVKDRMEADVKGAFRARLRREFLMRAQKNPDAYLVVDASLPVDEVAALVWERAATYL